MSYLTTLAQEAEKMKNTDPQAVTLLQRVAMLVTEAAMDGFLEDVTLSKQPRLRDALNKFEGCCERKESIRRQSLGSGLS